MWSGRRDSNSRHPPWQGGTLPAELLPLALLFSSLVLPFSLESYFLNFENSKTPALSYSPTTLRLKYHRRSRVSRPSSEWDGVGPRGCEHGGISSFCLVLLMVFVLLVLLSAWCFVPTDLRCFTTLVRVWCVCSSPDCDSDPAGSPSSPLGEHSAVGQVLE